MRKKWKQFQKGAIAVSCAMLAFGVLMIVWPGISALAACIVLGIFCMIAGAYTVVRYFKLGRAGVFFQSDLFFGICSILVGGLLLLHPYGAAMFLPIAAGIFVLIGSVGDIQKAMEMRRLHFGNWAIALVLGILNTVFAFLLLANPFGAAKVLMVFVGISLVVNGIRDLYLAHCISNAVKSSKNDEIIDVEWRSID